MLKYIYKFEVNLMKDINGFKLESKYNLKGKKYIRDFMEKQAFYLTHSKFCLLYTSDAADDA